MPKGKLCYDCNEALSDGIISELEIKLEAERKRADKAEQHLLAVTSDRDVLSARVDYWKRAYDEMAADRDLWKTRYDELTQGIHTLYHAWFPEKEDNTDAL